MTGKDLLTYFLNKYKKEYDISFAFTTVAEADIAVRKDALASTVHRLWIIDCITLIECQKLLKLIHSPDQENWAIVESIIETININDIQERIEQDKV